MYFIIAGGLHGTFYKVFLKDFYFDNQKLSYIYLSYPVGPRILLDGQIMPLDPTLPQFVLKSSLKCSWMCLK